jgi:hypothetical protein
MTTKPTPSPAWLYYQDWINFLDSDLIEFPNTTKIVTGDFETLGGIACGVSLETAYDVIAGEDVTVGGTLYTGTDQIIVPGCAFQQINGGGGVLGNTSIWGTTPAGTTLLAPVMIPEGRRITGVDWKYNRGGSGSIGFAIHRQLNGSLPVEVYGESVSTGTGWTTLSWTGVDYTLGSVAGSQTFLYAQLTANTQLLGCAIVTYDRLHP